MKILTVLLSLLAAPVLAQGYTEADARETLAACLDGADNVEACVGVVRAACVPLLPEDSREYVELSCGEAEFGAWYEAMQVEAERTFRAVDAFENGLLEAGANPDYLMIYKYLSEAQQGWEAYVRAHCGIAPLADALRRVDRLDSRNCAIEKYAARVAELRALVAYLE